MIQQRTTIMNALKPTINTLFTLLAFACAISSHAATDVYRCVTNGVVTYTQFPCPDGKQQPLKFPDTVSDAQQKKALADLQQEKNTVEKVAKERHQLNEKRDKQIAANVKKTEAIKKKCDALNLRVQTAKRDVKNASPKNTAKAKQKLQQAREKYALSCGSN
jgi:vacuolar-type H+-ATPase subunit I/STV1